MLHLITIGNLTKDAEFKKVNEDNMVVNFTVAKNLASKSNEKKVLYLECNYWISLKTETEESYVKKQEYIELLQSALIKGKKIDIHSKHIEILSSENNEGTKQYTNLKVRVDELYFNK